MPLAILMDGRLFSAPVIQSGISESLMITLGGMRRVRSLDEKRRKGEAKAFVAALSGEPMRARLVPKPMSGP